MRRSRKINSVKCLSCLLCISSFFCVYVRRVNEQRAIYISRKQKKRLKFCKYISTTLAVIIIKVLLNSKSISTNNHHHHLRKSKKVKSCRKFFFRMFVPSINIKIIRFRKVNETR